MANFSHLALVINTENISLPVLISWTPRFCLAYKF